jgi:hypothetical protein
MTHAFAGLFGSKGAAAPAMTPAPTVAQTTTPTVSPSVAAYAPGVGGQTPSFLGSAVLPPAAPTNQKRLLGA